MPEGAARAKASDGASLPAIVGSPVEHSPAHQRSAQVAWLRYLDSEACQCERATGHLLECSNGVLEVGQVVERLPRVPCCARSRTWNFMTSLAERNGRMPRHRSRIIKEGKRATCRLSAPKSSRGGGRFFFFCANFA